ncbi:MAG: class I SAM-dependent methyltransferase [Sphaerochaeta sp.]|jgi:predicted O-methyltransferase YrrM|nr:class I SAM-dependent methyltransferase [Sphaerochaeta sp.]
MGEAFDWTKVPGWFSPEEAAVYSAEFRSAGLRASMRLGRRDTAKAVEVGSYKGRSVCSAARAIVESGAHVFCVDLFEGFKDAEGGAGENFLGQFLRNVKAAGLTDFVSPFVGDSTASAASLAPTGPFDLVMVDAAHDYESVRRDVEAWWPIVAFGGVMIGHDYDERPGRGHDGVRRAVDEFFGEDAGQVKGTNLWRAVKRA